MISFSLEWIKASGSDIGEAIAIKDKTDLVDIGTQLSLFNGLYGEYGRGTGHIFKTR